MRRGWLLVVAVTCASGAACSLAVDGFSTALDVPDGGDASRDALGADADAADAAATIDASSPPSSDDAGTGDDGATVTDAGSDDDAGGIPVGTNVDFSDGCNDWAPFDDTMTPITTGRNGGACRICDDSNPSDGYSLTENLAAAPIVGESYHGSAWVRSDQPQEVAVYFRTYKDGPFTPVQFGSGDPAAATSSWTKFEVDFTPVAAAPYLQFYVYSIATSSGACLDIDDVVISRLSP